MTDKPLQFVRSLETQELVARLSQLKPGELVSYSELSVLINDVVNGQTIQTAKKIAEAENDIALRTERKKGVYRLTDEEIVEDTNWQRSKISRQSKRALERLSHVRNFAELPEDKKRVHQAHAAIYAIVAEKTATKTANRLKTVVKTDGTNLLAAIKQELI